MIRLTKVIRSGLVEVVASAKQAAHQSDAFLKAIDWLQHYIDTHEVVGGKITHGGWTYHKRTYKVWQSMIQRCENKNHKAFQSYGGRGISVCEKWKTFEGFFEDMGDAPDFKSLDRINNNAGYSKENCRWATPTEQAQNRRTSLYVEIDGVRISLAKACKDKGISYSTAATRLRNGNPIDIVLSKESFMGKKILARQAR